MVQASRADFWKDLKSRSPSLGPYTTVDGINPA